MFKKIEIWILYLVILLGIPVSISFGVLVRQELEGKTKLKKLDISFLSKPALSLARIPEKFLTSLLTTNPLRINKNRYFLNQDGFKGIPNSQKSYLLLSRFNGDLKEGIVELVDLSNFETLHTWNPDINAFNKLVKKTNEFKDILPNNRQLLYHPTLTRDGNLFFLSAPFRKILHKISTSKGANTCTFIFVI